MVPLSTVRGLWGLGYESLGECLQAALAPSFPQLTDCVDFQGSEYQEVSLLFPKLTLEHGCHFMTFEELVGRLILNKK